MKKTICDMNSLTMELKDKTAEINTVVEQINNIVIKNSKVSLDVYKRQDATCAKAGYTLFICKKCRNEKREEIPAAGHLHTEIKNAKEATCMKAGYTGDMYCKDCGEKISSGEVIAKLAHTWDLSLIHI